VRGPELFFFFFGLKFRRSEKNKKIKSEYSVAISPFYAENKSPNFEKKRICETFSSHLDFAFSFLAVLLTSFLNCGHLMLNPS